MDRISFLPDALRLRILEFLPIEDAIATGVLSKRWENLWCSLTIINFHQPTFERRSRGKRDFKDFVYQTLVLRDGSHIDKFTLSVDLDDLSTIHVNSWISFVVNRGVKEFHLSVLYGKLNRKLHWCLFTCKSLRVLTLDNVDLVLPSNMGFPRLETLKLMEVKFYDENLTNQLFSSCPSLVELFISNCDLNNVRVLRIIGSKLKFLVMLCSYPIPDVEITASCLHELEYFGYPPIISSETLSSLLRVGLRIVSLSSIINARRDMFYRRASDIMMGLHNVVEMALQGFFIEFLTRVQDSLACLPTYDSLEHLHLDMYPTKNQVQVIILLLRNFPNLKHLRIQVQQHMPAVRLNMDEGCRSLELSSEYSLKHLKKVDIESFEGTQKELDLVRFLLENADAIEKLNIVYTSQEMVDFLSQVSVQEKIESFSKASSNVVVSIS
ncbi:F-box protein [Thalictrum thalictroides]|uniref:F-box protein n=1 Tax=Thalictrum thalictroides TaxID=46969 RepID=A0A7J6X4I2_THATH|nr:F-box protein [Thalictrum thalictroides]